MKWFNNIKIRNKLFIVFGILLCSTLFLAIFAVVGIKATNDNIEEMIISYQRRQIYVAEAITDIYKIRLSNFSKIQASYSEKIDVSSLHAKHEEYVDSFRANINAFCALVMADKWFSDKEKKMRVDRVRHILDLFDMYVEMTKELDETVKLKSRADRIVKIENILKSSYNIGNKLTDELQGTLEKQGLRGLIFETTKQQVSRFMAFTAHTVIAIAGIAIVFVVLTAFLIAFTIRNINRPISDLGKAVVEISSGNLSVPIRIERKDELGLLANSIGDMVEEIVEYNKMTTIMDNLDSMICVCDLNYNLLFANKQMMDAYGFDREGNIGQKCYSVIRKNSAPCSFCKMAEFLPDKESLPYRNFEYVWDDDMNTWISGHESIIRWADGSLVFFRYVVNSAQKKQQEDLLNKTILEVKMASVAKSSFLANMSHEIRTPMNAILGITEIQLRDALTLEPEIREALTKIYNSGDMLMSIINDILDLSKIEAGKLELSPYKYEIASLINDAVTLNIMRIGGKPIEFVLSVDENTPLSMIGDEIRIKQILNNLLSNAFKYTEKGVVKLSICTETKGGDENNVTLVFSVSDTGKGMTDEQVARLFDEYSRFNTESNRSAEGTGLGMGIANNLINMMKGSISVKSEINWGSVFTVRLPQEVADSRVLGKELAENLQKLQLNYVKQIRKAQVVYEPMPYGKILVVDDMESNLYVTKGLLAPYKLSIETVISGFEAIDKIKEGNVYDIVFMDHMMPKMDGIEATKIIRGLGYEEPIVALTANAVVGQADVFLANGFDKFISKPIDMRQLYLVLKQFIRDKQPSEVIEAARQQEETAPAQPRVDPQLAEFFVKDALKVIAVLEKMQGNGDILDDKDMRMYITSVHAMKSTLANIGEANLSAAAAKLEQAGRDNDTAVMSAETPAFLSSLKVTIGKLASFEKTDENIQPEDGDGAYLREKLLAVKKACKEYDKKAAKTIINELRKKRWPKPTEELLAVMPGYLLGGDFEEVSDAAEKIIKEAV